MVKKINKQQFLDEAMKGLAVVDFSAEWCGPCKMLAPVLEELSNEIQADFYNVDVDENQQLAIQYGITNIPALLVMKDGEKKEILVGFKPKEVLEAELRALLEA